MTLWLDPTPVVVPTSFLSLGLEALAAQALVRRGLTTLESARPFLDPTQYIPAPPAELPGLTTAAGRVADAIRSSESICVWGDFDVDGQTATTTLIATLRDLGADVTYHIPVRADESHGVNISHLAPIIDQGARLILTCDTGISAQEAVAYARSRGVDFVITDHHDLPPDLAQAVAVTNPKLLPPAHPLAGLPGVGVAYKLAEELYARFGRVGECEKHLDLVALGIVADLAPLTGETRYLLQRGLSALRRAERLGLKTIMEMADLKPANLTEEHIGFSLAPRLNAIGRLSDANPVVELLTTNDQTRARLLSVQLEGFNSQRQLLTSQVYRASEEKLRSDPSLLTGPVIVLSQPSWPAGVIGIAASRLVERYHRPVIIFSTPQGKAAQGSARSVEGLNITAAIAAQKDLLLGFGGHPMAAGLSMDAAEIPAFTRRLVVTIDQMSLEAHLQEPSLDLDAWLSLPDVSLDLAVALEKLAPFGLGNPHLILAIRNLTMVNSSALGWKSDHLMLTIADKDGYTGQVFWWNGNPEELPDTGAVFDLAFHLRTTDFRGDSRVQLEFVDYRITAKPPVEVVHRRFEIIDYRQSPNPFETLETLKADDPGILIWAEANDRIELCGLDRNHLHETDKLAIWTTPASPDLFRFALDTVKPRTIYVFAVSPSADLPESFLHRLAGLVKYTINQRKGHVSLSELASATAHREVTVRFGLEWLAAAGHITLEANADDLLLSPGSQPANPILQRELLTALEGLLSETSAYRLYFTRMSTSQLQ